MSEKKDKKENTAGFNNGRKVGQIQKGKRKNYESFIKVVKSIVFRI